MEPVPAWVQVLLQSLMLAVTFAAACVVAWQSKETQRAANAAVDALKIAQAEESNSRQLVTEAIKTRIDSQSPTITIIPEPGVAYANDVTLPVRFPRDDAVGLSVRFAFKIANDGHNTVELVRRVYPYYSPGGPTEYESIILSPGQELTKTVEVGRMLSEWQAIADRAFSDEDEFRAEYNIERDVHIFFMTHTAADDGVADEYRFRLVGSPLKELVEERGSYDCGESGQEVPGMQVVAEPRRRTYYLSRRKGIELPALDSPVPTALEVSTDSKRPGFPARVGLAWRTLWGKG